LNRMESVLFVDSVIQAGTGMALVNIKEVTIALEKALASKKFPRQEIERLAMRMMDLFGFEDQVVDNRLTPEDRDIFYMLEEAGLVTTIEDDVQVQKGKTWRIYYWVLKEDQIHRLAHESEGKGSEMPAEADIYETVSDDVWKHHEENS
jgi:DNA-binding transcriptional ArsR family regulator